MILFLICPSSTQIHEAYAVDFIWKIYLHFGLNYYLPKSSMSTYLSAELSQEECEDVLFKEVCYFVKSHFICCCYCLNKLEPSLSWGMTFFIWGSSWRSGKKVVTCSALLWTRLTVPNQPCHILSWFLYKKILIYLELKLAVYVTPHTSRSFSIILKRTNFSLPLQSLVCSK